MIEVNYEGPEMWYETYFQPAYEEYDCVSEVFIDETWTLETFVLHGRWYAHAYSDESIPDVCEDLSKHQSYGTEQEAIQAEFKKHNIDFE